MAILRVWDQWMALREFLGAFLLNKELNKEWIFFYNSKDGRNMEDCFLENYGKMYKAREWRSTNIRLKGIAKELLWWKEIIEISYPYLDKWENINRKFTNDIIIKWAVKNNFMDDELLSFYREVVISNFDVYYDDYGHYVWLQLKNGKEDLSIDLDELLNKEIEQWYYNKIIWDRNRGYGYTHMLRRNLNLNLQKWQKTMMFNWKQFNLIAWSRRIWKTFISALIAYRELYKIWWGYWQRERQILYACVSEDKMWQPLQYIKQMIKKDVEAWYIKISWKEITNLVTWAVLKFVTAWSKSWAKSFGADLIIIDEAAEIPNEYWTDLLPIIMQEQSTVFAISTINEWSESWWFYRELVTWELTWDQEYNTIRVTIDDNELLDEKTREKTKQKIMETDPMKYWTELYCIFPSSNNVFKMSWVIQPPDSWEVNKSILIWYDPWKINDDAWVVVVDMNSLRAIEEHKLTNMTYKNQRLYLIDLKKKYPQATIVMDRTWVWEAVWEIVADVVDVCIKYKKSWWDVTYNEQFNYYNVPKKYLVETMQLYIEYYWFKVNYDLEWLITQMKWFRWINTWNYTEYKWVWVKDDLTNALLLCWFYMNKIKWLTWKNQIIEHNNSSKFIDNFDWQFLFEEYSDNARYKKFIY